MRQVHAAEMTLAQAPPCPPPASSPPSLQPAQPIAVPPAPPVAPERSDESRRLDEKVQKRGGKPGRLQFTLSWKTRDDLDLIVDCPGGRIGSHAGEKGPGVCGDGVKDIDANRNLRENMSSSPIENISWSAEIPDGEYTIQVLEYRATTGRGNTVPFTLRLRWGDQEKLCSDSVSTLPPDQRHRVGGKTVTGSYRKITWRSGSDLPECRFTHVDSISGPSK